MAIDFTMERWKRIKADSRKWWSGEFERPLIQIGMGGRETKRAKPDLPYHHFQSFYDFSVPVDRIVDWWEYHLDTQAFAGDSFPHVIPYFGPGIAAAFMGANVKNETGTTWFQPKEVVPASQLHLQHDPRSPWWPRVCDLYRAAKRRFGDLVQIDMTDLGGGVDILATFRPDERLLYDLYDAPAEVKRATWEGHELWWYYFDQINALIQPGNPGYTAWASIFSEEPYYMLQCDFCYMIGPEMFDEFVKPELAASCKRMKNAFYHLDGIGQLPHLDSLLTIPELKGIQWVPGDGQPDITNWPDVYRKIHRAGKRIQIFQSQSAKGWDALDIIADQIGTAKGIVMLGGVDIKQQDAALRFLDKYGAAG